MMPGHHLIRQYADLFTVEKERHASPAHRAGWLANFDARHDAIETIVRRRHGEALWMRRWRFSFLATAASSATPTAANGASATTG
jgi:cyclopropane-fatty-acyl-phospholipid synthase